MPSINNGTAGTNTKALHAEARKLWSEIKPQIPDPDTKPQIEANKKLIRVAYPGPDQLENARKVSEEIAAGSQLYPPGTERLAAVTRELRAYQDRSSFVFQRKVELPAVAVGVIAGGIASLLPASVAALVSAQPARAFQKTLLYGGVVGGILTGTPVQLLTSLVAAPFDVAEQRRGHAGSTVAAKWSQSLAACRRLPANIDTSLRVEGW